jgi:hypothetical protein
MLIPNWVETPETTSGRRVFVKSTIVRHGPVITGTGTYEAPAEYMSRRHSVIDLDGDEITLLIGSVAYKSKFNPNDPYEIHRRYMAGEWATLKSQSFDIVILPLEDALNWTGEPWSDALDLT